MRLRHTGRREGGTMGEKEKQAGTRQMKACVMMGGEGRKMGAGALIDGEGV